MEQIAFLIFSLLHLPLSVLAKAPKGDPDNDVNIHIHLNKSTGGKVKIVFDHWIILPPGGSRWGINLPQVGSR